MKSTYLVSRKDLECEHDWNLSAGMTEAANAACVFDTFYAWSDYERKLSYHRSREPREDFLRSDS